MYPQQQYGAVAPQQYGPPAGGTIAGPPPQLAAPASTAGGDVLKPEQISGALLIVHPREYIENISTSQGPSDAIKCDVVVLDQQGADGQQGRTYRDVLFFNKVLRASLRKQIGQFAFGRMGRGTAKGSNSAPWILVDATGDQAAMQVGSAFLARRPNWHEEDSDHSKLTAGQQQSAAQQVTGPHHWPQGAQPAQPYGQQYPQSAPPAGPYPPQGPQGYPQQPYGQPAPQPYPQGPGYPQQPGYAASGYPQGAPQMAGAQPVYPGSPEAVALQQQMYPQGGQG